MTRVKVAKQPPNTGNEIGHLILDNGDGTAWVRIDTTDDSVIRRVKQWEEV